MKTKYAIPIGIMTFLSHLSLCLQDCLLLARGIPSFYTSLCIGHQNKIFVVKETNEFLMTSFLVTSLYGYSSLYS